MKTAKLGAETVKTENGGVVTLTFPRLADSRVVKHAVSTRVGGVSRGPYDSLNLSYRVGDEPLRVKENRMLLSYALDMDLSRLVQVNQVHGNKVLKVNLSNWPKVGELLGDGDGLITSEPGIPLAILVADCLPVFFYDPTHKAIGLAHAGWRGTVGHVAAKTLLAMSEAFGTRPGEVRAAMGPCVGPCCYEVGENVKTELGCVFPWGGEVLRKCGEMQWKLDLPEANARQLVEIGLKPENLIRPKLCTIENIGLFYSHRAETSAQRATGRVGAFLMLVK